MAKICENCGRKCGFISGEPLLLNSDKVLCSKCATPIKTQVYELYNTKDEDNFNKCREEILSIGKDLYSSEVVDELMGLIYRISERKNFALNQQTGGNKKYNNTTVENNAVSGETSIRRAEETDISFGKSDKSLLNIQNEQLKTLKNIEKMIKFFVVLTIIGISISVISFFVTLANIL